MAAGDVLAEIAVRITADNSQFRKVLDDSKAGADGFVDKMQSSTKGTRQMGFLLQQASFGAQDFFLVLSNGNYTLTAFRNALMASSNNFAQVAAMIDPLKGAYIGLGITLGSIFIPALIQAGVHMLGLGDSAKDSEAKINRLTDAIGRLRDARMAAEGRAADKPLEDRKDIKDAEKRLDDNRAEQQRMRVERDDLPNVIAAIRAYANAKRQLDIEQRRFEIVGGEGGPGNLNAARNAAVRARLALEAVAKKPINPEDFDVGVLRAIPGAQPSKKEDKMVAEIEARMKKVDDDRRALRGEEIVQERQLAQERESANKNDADKFAKKLEDQKVIDALTIKGIRASIDGDSQREIILKSLRDTEREMQAIRNDKDMNREEQDERIAGIRKISAAQLQADLKKDASGKLDKELNEQDARLDEGNRKWEQHKQEMKAVRQGRLHGMEALRNENMEFLKAINPKEGERQGIMADFDAAVEVAKKVGGPGMDAQIALLGQKQQFELSQVGKKDEKSQFMGIAELSKSIQTALFPDKVQRATIDTAKHTAEAVKGIETLNKTIKELKLGMGE